MEMNMDLAKKIVDACYEDAKKKGLDMVFAVVNKHGELLAFNRMDEALLVSTKLAENKAWTAAALKMSTAELNLLIQPGGEFYGLQNFQDGRVVPFAGGIPLKSGDKIIGAVGVSGGSGEEDAGVCQAGVDYFNSL